MAAARSAASRACGCCAASGVVDPPSLDDYRAHGGYAALRRALELGPEGVIREVTDSKLVGRGGAAFPTGRKWDAVAASRSTALPRLQRRRVRAGHVQGSGHHRRRSVRADRGDDDRRLRDGLRARLRVPARRVPAGARTRSSTRSRRRGRAAFLGDDVLGQGFAFDIEIRQGRRRLHLRRGDGDLQLDRGLPRRAAQQAAVPGDARPLRQADRRQQRRDARQRARHRARGRPGLRVDRHGGLDRHEAVLRLRPRRSDPGVYEVAFGDDRCASCSTSPAASPAAAALQTVLLGGAAGGFVAARRARPAAHLRGARGPPARRSARASSWSSTTRSTCRGC